MPEKWVSLAIFWQSLPERWFCWQFLGNPCLKRVFILQCFGNNCLKFFLIWPCFVNHCLATCYLIVSPPEHQRTRFYPPPHLYSAHLTRWNSRCSSRCWTRWSFRCRCWSFRCLTRCWSLWAALHGSSSDGSPPSLCSSQSAPPLKSWKVVTCYDYESRAPGSL